MEKQECGFYELLCEKCSYNRSLNHNYLVFRKVSLEDMDDFSVRMMEENQIKSLLPMERRMENGEIASYYEVSSLQPIIRIYEIKTISGEDILLILREIIKAFFQMREYLLSEEGLVLHQDFIFMNPETKELRFLYCPFLKQDYGSMFWKLSEYFLDRIDHQDSEAVVLAYQFYKIVRNENFVLRELEELCQRQADKKGNKQKLEGADAYEKSRPQIYSQQSLKEAEEQNSSLQVQKWKLSKKKQDGIDIKKQFLIFSIIAVIAMVCLGKSSHALNSYSNIIAVGFLVFGIGGTVICFLLGKTALKGGGENECPKEVFCMEDGESKMQEDSQRKNGWTHAILPQETEGGLHQHENQWYEEVTSEKYIGKEAGTEQAVLYGKTEFCLITPEDEERVLVEKRHGKEILHKIMPLPFTIGKLKEMSDLYLPDTTVSRMHARIFEEEGKLYVMDLGSTNGTYLNGIGIGREEKMQLETGDELRIGKTEFVYQ